MFLSLFFFSNHVFLGTTTAVHGVVAGAVELGPGDRGVCLGAGGTEDIVDLVEHVVGHGDLAGALNPGAGMAKGDFEIVVNPVVFASVLIVIVVVVLMARMIDFDQDLVEVGLDLVELAQRLVGGRGLVGQEVGAEGVVLTAVDGVDVRGERVLDPAGGRLLRLHRLHEFGLGVRNRGRFVHLAREPPRALPVGEGVGFGGNSPVWHLIRHHPLQLDVFQVPHRGFASRRLHLDRTEGGSAGMVAIWRGPGLASRPSEFHGGVILADLRVNTSQFGRSAFHDCWFGDEMKVV